MLSGRGGDCARAKGITMIRRMWMAMALLATGCANHRNVAPVEQPPFSPPHAAGQTNPMTPREMLLGKSVKGAPITLTIFGDGAATIFILGGIHGDETTSVVLTTNLI